MKILEQLNQLDALKAEYAELKPRVYAALDHFKTLETSDPAVQRYISVREEWNRLSKWLYALETMIGSLESLKRYEENSKRATSDINT